MGNHSIGAAGTVGSKRTVTNSGQGRKRNSLGHQRRSPGDLQPVVDAKDLHTGPSNFSDSQKNGSIPAKMLWPAIHSWIEEECNCTGQRVSASEVGSLVAVTVLARERKVFGLRPAAVLFRNDVVNLQSQKPELARKEAVLAAITCTTLHKGPQLRIHGGLCGQPGGLQTHASLRLGNAQDGVKDKIYVKFFSLFGRQRAGARFGAQGIGSVQILVCELPLQEGARLFWRKITHTGPDRTLQDASDRASTMISAHQVYFTKAETHVQLSYRFPSTFEEPFAQTFDPQKKLNTGWVYRLQHSSP